MNAHILAVEDSRTQAEALRGDLVRAGHDVTLARSGEEALEFLEAGSRYDLMVSDIMMPGIDGYQLCRRVKDRLGMDELPVILLTSLKDPVDIVRGLEAGADNFLTKPYDPDQLISRVDSVLQTADERAHSGRFRMGAQVRLLGHRFTVDADRQQILDLLMSSFEDLVYTNGRLREREEELVLAREHAVMANEAKSRFLANLGHELRTPLTAVIGFADLLVRSRLPDEDHQAVEQILYAGKHLQQLIADLVDIGGIESGDLQLAADRVNVPSVVREAVQLVQVLADQRGVQLPDLAELPDCHAAADPRRLRQVFVNLLSNAVKYNRPGGRVGVQCRANAATLDIDVIDTGRGIPVDRLGRLFVPFERLGAEDTDIEGTGIGLALVRELVEAMGGTVAVTETSPAGTTFRVSLPVADALDAG